MHTHAWAVSHVDPAIKRVLLPCGTVFDAGGVMYPDCGHRPVDFQIVGFGFCGPGGAYLAAFGYHVASKPRRYMRRGLWEAALVDVNPGVSAALDGLIRGVNARFTTAPPSPRPPRSS